MLSRDIFEFPFLFSHWLRKLGDIAAFDCETNDETNYLRLEIIGFSLSDGKQACYVDLRGKYKNELLGLLAYYIEERCKLLIMHNAPFDMSVLHKYGIEI